MDTLLIIKAQVVPQPLPCLTGTRVIFDVYFLIYHRSPQPFSKNVIERSPFAIHADPHVMGEEQLRVLWAGKLTALIAITNLRPGLRERSLHRLQHKTYLHGLIQFPTDYVA